MGVSQQPGESGGGQYLCADPYIYQDYLTNQIIAAAIEYDLDGINLDFEALSGEVGMRISSLSGVVIEM